MHTITRKRVSGGIAVVAVVLALAGCGNGGGSGGTQQPADFVAEASDFECLQNWTRVRNIRLTNRRGFLDEAVALAQSPEAGKQYPVGTIIQLFPGEAMVKRAPGYDPANHDWEYFELNVSADGTEIRKRGRDESLNMFGGQCFGCHEAAKEFDFICEEDHGCVKLPVTGAQIAVLQDSDPRCGN